ncbi:MAG: hypothetical protein KME28_20395 [Pelatocladus maniniholoensis HA4357-MV3]|jgi:hypothetical protein|uniref:Uncharacterized protein n=1 Tax=Pelatocladus maniniholoensis HA4357-MV3 TaxID=1117104 RepID=A0A9E3HC44_9NOST|nr:hypothetical protein [Pelatocladus maniniholoensis HA4357-MV3]
MGFHNYFADEKPEAEPTVISAFEIPSRVSEIFNTLWEDDHHKKLIEGLKATDKPSFQKQNAINRQIAKRKAEVVTTIFQDFIGDIETLNPAIPEFKQKSCWYSYTTTHPIHKSIVVDNEHRDLYTQVHREYAQKFIQLGDNIINDTPVMRSGDGRRAGHKKAIQVELPVSLVEKLEHTANRYQLTIHDVAAQAIERYSEKQTRLKDKPVIVPNIGVSVEQEKFIEELVK